MRSLLTPTPFRCAVSAIAVAAALAGDASATAVAPAPDIQADIVSIARGELHKGIREAPMGSDNSNGIARYRGALDPRPHGGPWCAYFASWVTRRAGVPLGSRGNGIASAAGIRAWAQRTGRWRHLPRAGDIAVFSHHVGIVVYVTGSRMTTIDGNWSNRVSRVSRRRYEAIGFARAAAR
jgi:hypothetical protein